MGAIQDYTYLVDAGVGTAAQVLNLAGLLTEGEINPNLLAREGYQLIENGLQLYGSVQRAGGVSGIADDPQLYTPGELARNSVGGILSGYGLTQVGQRIRTVKELNAQDPSRVRDVLRYASVGAAALSDGLNVAESGLRIARVAGLDI